MILLSNMDTFIRDSNPHSATIIQIMHCVNILPTMKRMEPEGEAEVEGGEKGTGILAAPAPGGKDLEGILVTTEVPVPIVQGHLSWMDLMDPTGEEKTQAGIWNKAVKTRMPGRKNLGGLARSRGGDIKMKGVITLRRTTQQQEVRGQMTLK